MDPVTSLDEDDDDFFGSYAADQASALDFDEMEPPPPTEQQLAHWARFRRPVALVVAGMALLSVVALGTRSARQPSYERELITHYGSALAAPTRAAITTSTVEQTALAPEASSAQPPSALVPEALSSFVADALAVFVPKTSSGAAAAAAAPTDTATVAMFEPSTPSTAFTGLFTQRDSNPVRAFIAALTQTCLQHVASESTGPLQSSFTFDHLSD